MSVRRCDLGGEGGAGATVMHSARQVAAALDRRAPLPRPVEIGWRRRLVAATVEREVIPRLLLAHPRPPRPAALAPRAAGAADVASLVGLVLARSGAASGAAEALVADLRSDGVSAESVLLDLLTPTARRLGELWVADECDFTEVTIGLWSLQQIAREMEAAFGAAAARPDAPRALLLPVPGEQHTFGLGMVAQFFRRAGWAVREEVAATPGALGTLLRRESFALVGLSVGCGDRLDAVHAAVRLARSASRNPFIRVMVGGPAFVQDPALAAEVGADATASDAREAVVRAEALVTVAREGR